MNAREYTFQSLFGSTFEFKGNSITLSKIEIPIIQRDYAQGRENDKVNRIRERFLDALFKAIVENTHITLDFIYGDVSNDGILTPLDGQQRLTTLFLLHWYIAKKEEIDVSEYKFLNCFTYATRFSSRDFCQELIKYDPNFNDEKLSAAIIDQPWYPYEWKNDPTIQSILVMIDAIHKKFNAQSELWKSLVTNKIISFYFLPLSEMGLTDDLYIKMNSRGKLLTPFEHFKAEFENIIKGISHELAEEINIKIDIDWTNMLFPFRSSDDTIDDKFMNYFHFISDIITYKLGDQLAEDEFKAAQLLYSNENDKAKDNISYLISSFDCWLKLDIVMFFENTFANDEYQSGKVKIYQDDLNIFKECLGYEGENSWKKRRFPLNKMLLLYSIITYLQNRDRISNTDFCRRIRIVRNLIWNSTDEIRKERMKTLLKESETIILSGEIPISERGEPGFNVRQKEEERKKIAWVLDNQVNEDELYHLEDHSLLKGCISIVDLNASNNFKKFRLLFDKCNKDLINRVLLTIGDYSQSISWRFQLGASNNDSVWFGLFHPTEQRARFEYTFEIINKLLSSLDETDINNEYLEKCVDKYLENKETPKDWRYYLVKYTPMRQGKFGMYHWVNYPDKNYNVIMMNTEKSLSGRNWNIFLCTLYQLPEFTDKLSLDNYSYQGDMLKIKNTDYQIECKNDMYVVYQNELKVEYPIQQIDGIDIEDRIERGKEIINALLDKISN